MLVFASPVPSAFARLGALQPRHVERPSAEEQYFQTLAEEHERAAALARQRLNEARRRQHQQHELEAQLRLQQELATALHVRTPQRSPYQTPARSFGRALPCASDVIFEFGDNDACDAYAERMHRRSQLATIERQKRAEQQNMLRALFEEQRRAQAERVAQLHRQRAEQAKAEQERRRKAQEEQARRHLAARAADEEKLRQFFQALVGEMGAASEAQGADLERKNALRRSSVPVPPKEAPVPAPATRSAPASPAAAPTLVERSASPAPSVASDASDASLNSIALLQDKYNSLRSSFTFPSTLSFAAPSRSTPGSSPTLLYNPTNAPVHAYENALTNLLTELDAVESFGDAHVRDVRRSLVKNVEAELEALEEKKREAWRQQAGEVESPVESAPLPVEVAVESTPVETAPAVESAPVESAPVELEPVVLVTEDESTESTESPNPVSWLATRLSQPSESEDDEVKAVRENLLARLTETATEPAVGLVTETETVTEAAPTEPEPEPEPTVQETESAPELPTSPDAVESPTQPETVPAESASEPAVESSPVESAPEPEAADAHTSDLVTEAPSTEAPVTTTEAPVTEAPAIVATEPETTATEPETTATESESITTEPETIASEPEVPLTTPVEFTPESDASSITSSDEPEVITQHEAQSESEVESPVLAEPEPESAALAPAQSEPAPAQSEPSSAPAPTHEHSTFVQVFPDSDSDADTDADLASELADRKSINGDEFELL